MLNEYLLCYKLSPGVLERNKMCLIPLWIGSYKESIFITFHVSLVPAGGEGWYTVGAQ